MKAKTWQRAWDVCIAMLVGIQAFFMYGAITAPVMGARVFYAIELSLVSFGLGCQLQQRYILRQFALAVSGKLPLAQSSAILARWEQNVGAYPKLVDAAARVVVPVVVGLLGIAYLVLK